MANVASNPLSAGMNAADRIAEAWMQKLEDAVKNVDLECFLDCIEPDGWLKDLMTFTWDFKTVRGHDSIRTYLAGTFADTRLSKIALDSNPHGRARVSDLGNRSVVEVAIKFETDKAYGKGFARVLRPKDDGHPRAMCLMMTLSDLKGHEEREYESGLYDGHNVSWKEVSEQRRAEIERDPHVLIVGAGQNGLMIAARMRQMNIKALVIDRTARVGDVWRNRYPTLALHTPRSHHCFLYQDFPSNWPMFTPKDKFADWMEQYAETQDLVVWNSTTLEPKPKYSAVTKRWDVMVNKNGKPIALRPAHIVMATSQFGDLRIPILAGSDTFKGDILHTSAFPGGAPFAGKRVVVVGAGNSSADICQDLAYRGAAEVTMVQRSATTVVSDKLLAVTFSPAFSETVPTEYNDLAFAGMPIDALRLIGAEMLPFTKQFDKKMHDGLRNAGFKIWDGPEHTQLVMIFSRGGGYIIDVGWAPLVIEGKVKIKQSTEIDHLTPSSVVFKDGSELEADAIILATGWQAARTYLRRVFDEDVIDRTSEIWGLDEGGEARAGFKPSGHPGLWFAVGDCHFSRFLSKHLAMFIKAIELGYLSA